MFNFQLPLAIQKKVEERIVEQNNTYCPYLRTTKDQEMGNFNFDETLEGHEFWQNVLSNNNYLEFFKLYPYTINYKDTSVCIEVKDNDWKFSKEILRASYIRGKLMSQFYQVSKELYGPYYFDSLIELEKQVKYIVDSIPYDELSSIYHTKNDNREKSFIVIIETLLKLKVDNNVKILNIKNIIPVYQELLLKPNYDFISYDNSMFDSLRNILSNIHAKKQMNTIDFNMLIEFTIAIAINNPDLKIKIKDLFLEYV